MASKTRTFIKHCISAICVFALIGVLAQLFLPIRFRSAWRRRRRILPFVAFGPSASINNVDYVAALRRVGGRGATLVYDYDGIMPVGSVDTSFAACRRYVPGFLLAYPVFIYVLLRFDAFFFYFNVEGYLAKTPLRYIEYPLLKLFGKKIVAQGYGSDVQRKNLMPELLRPFYAPENDKIIDRNVRHTARWSDFKIAGGDLYLHMPYDLCLPLITNDVESIKPEYPRPANDHTVRVVHATGHPQLKGTAAIEQACEELRQEGLDVDYVFVSGLRNDEARKIYATADIIVDQLLCGAHGLFAVEAMALGKPVVTNLSPGVLAANPSVARAPLVNATCDTIKEKLRELIIDPELRFHLGQLSRQHAEKYHSYRFIGSLFNSIFKHVWLGDPFPDVIRLAESCDREPLSCPAMVR